MRRCEQPWEWGDGSSLEHQGHYLRRAQWVKIRWGSMQGHPRPLLKEVPHYQENSGNSALPGLAHKALCTVSQASMFFLTDSRDKSSSLVKQTCTSPTLHFSHMAHSLCYAPLLLHKHFAWVVAPFLTLNTCHSSPIQHMLSCRSCVFCLFLYGSLGAWYMWDVDRFKKQTVVGAEFNP